MIRLAHALKAQSRLPAAEQLLRRALKGRVEILGPKHPRTLGSLHDLSSVLRSQHKYDQALEMNRLVREGQDNKSDIEKAASAPFNDFSLILVGQGRYEEAEDVNRQVLAATEVLYGTGSYSTLISMGNLAELMRKRGNLEPALELNLRTLAPRRKNFPPDDPETLNNLHNLATVYEDQGNYAQAEVIYRDALQLSILGRCTR